MTVLETAVPGVLIIETKIRRDDRGFVMETYRIDRYAALGITSPLVHGSLSFSRKGVLRGLHLQHPYAQWKLVQVMSGELLDVAVDIRRGSPTFGRWVNVALSGANQRWLCIPRGCARGYLMTGETALFTYQNTDYYIPETEVAIRWNDPDIGIDWPLGGAVPELSAKGAGAAYFSEIPPERLLGYEDHP
jgi:dTDP-4-dehydrorhamnose 3,5-epimerase